MILQRLVEYYDRLAAEPQSSKALAKPGYSIQKISFCIVIEADGRLQQFQSLLDVANKRSIPRQMSVPGQSKPTGSGINPCFLWDNAAYMLGYKPEDLKPERTRESFEAFRDEHLERESAVHSSAYSAVCRFLRSWTPSAAEDYTATLQGITSSFGVFRLAGEQTFVHDDPKVLDYWAGQALGETNAVEGLCLVTGEIGSIARLHEPKIKNVRDTQSAGALLVSFNADAYTSFGKDQSYNAPVGSVAAFKYANALNSLLLRNDRRMFIGDATVTFWSERPTHLENFASDIWGEAPPPDLDTPAEDKLKTEQVRLYLSQLREGFHSGGFDEDKDENQTRFFVLGLSPNASRISVRFWIDSTVGEMKARLAQHMADTEMTGARDDDPPLMIRRIVAATGRAELDRGRFKGYDAGAVSPLLAGAIARAVLTGGPYPQSLLATLINRIKVDGSIRHERVAAIKAVIVRNSRIQKQPKEVPVALDPDRTDPAYVTGRLFALLEKIQTDSLGGDLNATIKDRYFSAASATPGLVFPRLIRLSQHHLAKLETGQKIYYERLLGEAIGKLQSFANHLMLADQGLFAIGYFHQRQALFTPKKKEAEAA